MSSIKVQADKEIPLELLAELHDELVGLGIPLEGLDTNGLLTFPDDTDVGRQNQATDHIRTNFNVAQRLQAREQRIADEARFQAWRTDQRRKEWEQAGKPGPSNNPGNS